MNKLMNRIQVEAKKKKYTNQIVGAKLNVSAGMISNYYSVKSKMSLMKFVELVNFVFEDNQISIQKYVHQFITLTAQDPLTKEPDLREIAEWCAMKGATTVLTHIFKNNIDNPFFQCYELLMKRNERSIHPKELYIELKNLSYQNKNFLESRVICDIAFLYADFDLRNFNIEFLAIEVLGQIAKIKSEYLREAYSLRVKEILAVISLKKNDIESSRKYAMEIITGSSVDIFPLQICSMYNLLSESYVFDDFEKSIYYNNQACKVFEEAAIEGYSNRRSMLQSTHDFIKIHNNDLTNLFLNDAAEIAHYYAKLGGSENKEKCIAVLDELEKENGILSPHQQYYKALALRDSEQMNNALESFINLGDTYYARLPKNQLLNEFR